MSETGMGLPPRVNLVTLGVGDLAASIAFYTRLGWRSSASAGSDEVAFFALGNLVLGLYPRHLLAQDAQVADTGPGFSGVTLAINLASEQAVDEAMAAALAAGARQAKAPEKVFWGGYSGYFADPDGHLWELAFNPFFPQDEAGLIVLPE